MTMAVIKSFNPDHGLVIVKIDGRAADIALRLGSSDRSIVAKLPPGQRIRFDFQCGRHGQVYAIDVSAV